MCLETGTRAREAALQGNLELAEKLITEARALCGQRSVLPLRRAEEVLAEKRQVERELARERALPEEESRPSRSFVRWVIESRAAIAQHAADVQCAAQGSPAFGFCEGTHPRSKGMRVRYWQAQEGAFRFSFTSLEPLSCLALGEQRRVRVWTRAGVTYELCEPTDHDLRSLSALLVQAPDGHTLHVFTPAYVRRDAAFERLLEGR